MLLIRQAFQRLFSASSALPSLGGGINATQARTKVITKLPHPTEIKRVRKQGFKRFMQTKSGRNQIRERILRGDKVLAH